MDTQTLLDPEIQKFIRDHEKADVATLALKKPPSAEWPYKAILDQIKSRQKAEHKIEPWLSHEGILFPPPSTMEQASSSATSLYKAVLTVGDSFVDLTAGSGIDSWAFAQHFKSGICVDHDENTAALLKHNINSLGLNHLHVENMLAEDFVKTMQDVDLVYIDPQRRDTQKKGKFILSDCSPDIFSLLPNLLKKSRYVMLKTSPMLDIQEAIKQLGCVHSVHILQYMGECKEVIYMLRAEDAPELELVPIHAVSLSPNGEAIKGISFTIKKEQNCAYVLAMPQKYLYEPGPAFLKSGAFRTLAKKFRLQKIHEHTHLYTSKNPFPDFPGRFFEIQGVYQPKAGDLPLKKANITVRNYPETPENIRKKLKLKDGGPDTVFACTLMDETKAFIHVTKAD